MEITQYIIVITAKLLKKSEKLSLRYLAVITAAEVIYVL